MFEKTVLMTYLASFFLPMDNRLKKKHLSIISIATMLTAHK